MSALAELLAEVPAALAHELEVLLRVILLSNSPSDAISKAQRFILADAADAATDKALQALLKK